MENRTLQLECCILKRQSERSDGHNENSARKINFSHPTKTKSDGAAKRMIDWLQCALGSGPFKRPQWLPDWSNGQLFIETIRCLRNMCVS